MNIFTLISHLGTLLKVGKDVEQLVRDIVAKKATADEVKAVIQDAAQLLGLMNVGLSADEMKAVQDGLASLLAEIR